MATPTFSLVAGSYAGTQSVTISDATSGATCYYTLTTNGTTPTTLSTKYSSTSPISVTATSVLEALCAFSGDTNSGVATAAYTITPLTGTLSVYIDAPAIQSSSVAGVTTETFDALTPGKQTASFAWKVNTTTIGTYAATPTVPFAIDAPGLYGGATDSSSPSQTTNYFSVGGDSGSTSPTYLTLTNPAAYVGFWWSAGDTNNRVALYSGSTLYGTFSTADLLKILNSGSGTVTALNGSTYNTSAYFGNPNLTAPNNDATEPFAYVSFVITGATINQIAFYNTTTGSGSSSFESDNHSIISSGSTVTIPATLVPVESMSISPQSVTVTVAPGSANVSAGGTQQFTATVTGSTNTAVNWTISPTTGAGAVSSSGLYTAPTTVTTPETVTITATSQASTTVSASGTVNLKLTPTLTFTAISAKTYGAAPFTVSASSASSGAITYSVTSGPATISGSTVTITGVGNVVLGASQAATTTYSAATASTSFNVTAATPTVTVTSTTGTYGTPLTLTATSTYLNNGVATATGQTPSYTLVSGPATLSNGVLTFTGAGSVVVTAGVSATGNFAAASSPQTTITVLAGPSFTLAASPASLNIGQGSFGTSTVTMTGANGFSGSVNLAVSGLPDGVTAAFATNPTAGTSVLTLMVSNSASVGPATITITGTSGSLTASTSIALTVAAPQCGTNVYNYARAITIDHTKVPNTDQANFPFLFSTTDPLLATTANGGHVANANGYDIVFTSDPAGQNPLPFEMEEYDPVHGGVIAWVQVPMLSHTTDMTIYLSYGNSGVTASQQNPAGVWDSNYKGVWHLANAASGTAIDSTANMNNGTSQGVATINGQIAGAGSFDGISSYIEIPSTDFASYPTSGSTTTGYSASFGVWFKTSSAGVILGQTEGTEPNSSPSGYVPALYVDTAGLLRASMFWHGSGSSQIVTAKAYNDNNWHFTVDTYANGTETLYVDGQNAGSQQVTEYSYGSSYAYFLGTGDASTWPEANGGWLYLNGALDEVSISNVARSADWIATEYNNQSSPSTFFNFSAESIEISPASATLYELQTQQFANLLQNSCSSGITWSISPAGSGSITQNGLYTAPASITTQQTVIVTATIPGDSSLPAPATVILMPPLSVSVSPATATLYGGYVQQFTASVTNATNTAVNWTISPAGTGTIDSTGLYTAPATISAQQVVTITATSQADPTKSATALVTLAPTQCTASFQRQIVIDHTKVPNTDQVNFPFLLSTTDPSLATMANGGHVYSPSGNDIIFSADPNGATKLDYELEEYDPVHGQVIAWIRIPTLSHTTDTSIYMFYGNSSITTPQQNPAGVWDQKFQGVWHLDGNGTMVSLADSTANLNNGTANGSPVAITGEISGAIDFVGYGDNLAIRDIPLNGVDYTVSAWFAMPLPTNGSWNTLTRGVNSEHQVIVDESNWHLGAYANSGGFQDSGFAVNSLSNGWHHLEAAATGNTTTFYVDGIQVGTIPFQSSTDIGFLGNYQGGGQPFGGVDEMRISTGVARSADWIATEYMNQSSPSTFYSLFSESLDGTTRLTPASTSLLAGQSQRFAMLGVGSCSPIAIGWAINPVVGAIDVNGLYSSPAIISAQQTVIVTGTNQANNSAASASVTLLPSSGGPVGTVVTINGAGFGSTEGSSSVTVGGLPAVTLAWSDTQIQAQIPTRTGLGTQNIVVTVGGQTISSTTFNVTAGLTGITPPLNSPAGVPGSVTINTSGQNGPLLFYGSQGQIVTVALGNDTLTNWAGSVNMTILNPDGTTLPSNSLCDNPGSGCQLVTSPIVLPHTGLYTLVVDPEGATGSISFTLVLFNNLTGTITPGIPKTSTINIPGQEELLTFIGIASQTATLQISNDSFNTWAGTFTIDIINPDGTALPSSSLCDNAQSGCALITNPVVLPQSGIYTVLVNPGGATGGVTLLLTETASFTINPTSVTLWGSQVQQFTATLNGDTNSAVNWTLTPAMGAGTLSSMGLYTAPASISAQQTVTVTATSVANRTQSVSATVTLIPHGVTVTPSIAVLYSGQAQAFTATCTSSCPASMSWSMIPSGVGTLAPNGLTASYTAPANITAQQTVTITATNPIDNTYVSAVVTLMPPALTPALSLIAVAPSPYPTGASQAFYAILKNRDGTPLSGGAATFTVTGANNNSGSGTTDSTGIATYTYIGVHSGNDVVHATASIGSEQVTSNSVSATWVAPAQSISTSTVTGRFFLSGNSGIFDTPANTPPVFVQTFPSLIFNPPAGTIPGLTTVDNGSRPFTNVTTDVNGNVTGTIAAQGNGYQAGCGPTTGGSCNNNVLGDMYQFQAVFSGEFTVASAGNVVFTYIYDDSFILGIGNGATLVGDSAILNAPAVTAFDQLPVMGSVGLSFTSPTSIVVNFPSPGTYPFEVDYDECCAGSLIMVLTASGTNSTGVPATGSLTLSPNSVNPLPVGGSQTFTVLATDASGNPLPNASVGLVVTGDDELQLSGITDSSGNATIVYNDVNPGTACVQAVAFIDGMVTYSNQVSVPWTLSPGTNTGAGGSDTLSIGISALSPDILPNTLQLNGSATDSALPTGETISGTWSEVSGPGTVSFSLQQSSMNGTSGTYAATATFDAPGAYVLELTASDFTSSNQPLNSGSAQISIEVDPAPPTTQGWIGSPENGAQVSGIVPITVVPGETLNLCVVTVYPANNPNAATTLNCNTGGTSQLASWDTTQVPNGTYWITLQATDSNGNSSYNLALVTVVGSYKPGRVTTTVTDIVVPATGLPIQIQRTYDSLNAATVGDFGYGWNLGINVNLTVDNKGDVTFTLGGQRKTFNLTPTNLSWLFSWYAPVFTPEPGLYGSLTDSSPGCPLDMLLADGECVGGGYYNPPGYIYTDPNGTSYTISAGGQLQSIADRSGNGLTITPNGLTSTTGLNVPFVRDSKNRITQITDPAGNVYSYGYDANGNLASVTYPQTANSQTCPGANASNTSQYSYYPNAEHPNYPAHFYAGGTDGRCYPLPVTTYFDSTNDNGDSSLDGRLASVTDGLGNTTSYAYVLSTTSTINGAEVPNTGVTTITYPKEPADGNGQPDVATMIYDSQGDLLSSTDPLKNTTTNTYDANRNLLSTTDPLGNTTNYTYDANGNKTSITYPTTATSTKTTSITNYNQYSEPTSTIDELGNTRTFNYDVNYNPASVTDSVGTLMSTEFNSSGQMLSGAIGYDINQSPSRASQFTYDAFGNLASKTDALGRTTSYTYNSLGQKTTMTEPIPSGSSAAAATTTYTYDAFGNLTQTSAPLGRVSSSQYDANGNKISDTDARNNTTNYKYDPLNRLIETDYPDGTTATKTYDFRGNVVKETDQDGHVTQHVYDLAGRQVSVTQASGTSNATTTSYAYDNAGRKTSETDALNHTTAYTYDNAGNLLSTSGVAGNFTYTYDNARNRIAMTDGNSNTTQYAYDARKRLTVTTYPDKTAKTNAYDGPGNLISVTDQANNVVQYTYDAANQLINVVQASSPNTGQNTTIYGYDSNGNPIALEDANTHTTNNVFDVLSELTSKTLPDATHTETRTYDNNGNLQSVTHFNNVTTTYTYDALNRLLSRSTPGETPVSFTYTATGKRQTMTDQSGTTTYSYDSMDRLSSKATPEGTLGYTYDAAGNLATMISSNAHGVSTSYRYDDLNRLASVADANLAGSNTTSYTYDNANNVGTVKYPNGIETQFTYDLLNRVSTVNSQVSGYTYQRGPTGNLTSAVELNGRTANWTYDGIYRLTNESIASDPSKNNGSVSYGLDPVGNRSSAVSSLGGVPSGSWGYNVDDEVSSETYDANGNVLLTGGKTFTYDSENHMVTMAAIGTAVTIIYDGDGNRVAKTVNGVTTYYLVDDLNPTGYPQVVEELSGAGVVTRQYTYGLQRIDENQILNNAWTPSFYGYDGGGNVRNLTNAARTVTDSYEYDAYGNLSTVTGSTPNNMLYRGEEYDSDLGLYYLRARYYNPLTGRFMSRDPYEPKFRGPDGKPIDPKNLHKYLYAVGDPVNFRDPSGRASLTEVVLAISMAAGSIFGAPNEVEELEHIEVAVEYIDEAIETVLTETAPGPGPPPPTP